MYISSLSIRNFRNFQNTKFYFKKGINTVIGENGAGKSNLFFALRLLLDDSMPRNVRLSSADFNRALGKQWAGHWIVISIEFEDLGSTEEGKALAVQLAGRMDTESTGSYSLLFRPKYNFRKNLYDYSQVTEKNITGLNLLTDEITIDDYETVLLCRGAGDFSEDAVYKRYVGDFDALSFPDPDEKEELIFGTRLPNQLNIFDEVSCTFIKALRDVEADLRSYNSNPLVSLLRGKEKTVKVAQQREIIDSIDALNNKIGELKEVEIVKKGIDRSLKEAVGTTYAPNINIRSELPNEMERLFQSLRLWVGDPDEVGYEGRIWELSLGGANLIYLSLKLLEYENVKADKIANLLLIEEPEAHIHTHIQKTLFDSLKENHTQVIITTHSTHISSVSKISSVNILSRGFQKADVFYPSNGLDPEHVGRIERYLDAVRSNLLFAKGVLLVEGDAEQILIPELFRKVIGLSLDEIGVSLVNIGSTGFTNIAQIFHETRIRKNCAIITDLDTSVVKLPDDPSMDTKYQKHCRASEKSGAERMLSLNDFCDETDFVQPFYGEYTFEVDLLMCENNSFEYVKCLKKIYKNRANRERSKKKLESGSVDIAGVEVLRLAKKFGKGWLALLVAEQVFCRTDIPGYILEAIAFASSHINNASKAKAIFYRLKAMRGDKSMTYHDEANEFNEIDKPVETLIEEFCEQFPDDQVTEFLALL